jgi:hypothetical protein
MRGYIALGLWPVVFLLASIAPQAQEPAPEPDQEQAAPAIGPQIVRVTVRGVVLNAATGQPLPRALVHIEGDADSGALTDGAGSFEIPGVPTGPQIFEVVKPGFYDRGAAAGDLGVGAIEKSNHNVLVDAEMPKLTFTLAPTSAIRGQVELSSGDPGEGITVALLRRTVQDGRAVWPEAAFTKTNSEGFYRFGGLADGEYAIYTETAMDSEPAATPAGGGGTVERAGYVSVFYLDARDLYLNARDLAGATKIRLERGEQAQANFALTLEPFHTVSATVVLPEDRVPAPAKAGKAAEPDDAVYSGAVMDAAGHRLLYDTNYNRKTHAVQTLLPDGSYTLLAFSLQDYEKMSHIAAADAGPLAGSVDFTVAGHAVRNLRIPVSASHLNQIELSIKRSFPSSVHPGTLQSKEDLAQVMLSPSGGWVLDGTVSDYANGSRPGPMETTFTLPGSWWVHTHIGQKGLCEASFTAGGTSLAREPANLGFSGLTAHMELTLRDDCAKLMLSLPAALSAPAPGEEPFYSVYVVPDFDSTVDVQPITLRPSSGGSITLEDLTPGNYHVYTFDAPVRLEYRNPAALAALPSPGQAITLSPGTTGNLVLEVESH